VHWESSNSPPLRSVAAQIMADNSMTAASAAPPDRDDYQPDRRAMASLEPEVLAATAARMRARLSNASSVDVAGILTRALAAWRDREFGPRRAAAAAIATAWGYTEALMDASFDALFEPFSETAVAVAATELNRKKPAESPIVGLIMPGNLPGAGIHEVLIALLGGAGVILKTATSEPIFFATLARTLRQLDKRLGDRIAVFSWSRARHDLTKTLRANCDWLAAFGDGDTLARLATTHENNWNPGVMDGRGTAPMLKAGFGIRFSGAYVSMDAAAGGLERANIAQALASDVTLFEQMGCLSPQHIFVESETYSTSLNGAERPTGQARDFAADLALALGRLAVILPPPRRLGLEAAAAVRRARETARWRRLGGEPVELWEGQGLGWTVIYDESAYFKPSPGFRTVTVTSVTTPAELARRLEPVAGQIEAFALAGEPAKLDGVRRCLIQHGASYLCVPGAMQSPPLQWRHGGGIFLDAIANR